MCTHLIITDGFIEINALNIYSHRLFNLFLGFHSVCQKNIIIITDSCKVYVYLQTVYSYWSFYSLSFIGVSTKLIACMFVSDGTHQRYSYEATKATCPRQRPYCSKITGPAQCFPCEWTLPALARNNNKPTYRSSILLTSSLSTFVRYRYVM